MSVHSWDFLALIQSQSQVHYTHVQSHRQKGNGVFLEANSISFVWPNWLDPSQCPRWRIHIAIKSSKSFLCFILHLQGVFPKYGGNEVSVSRFVWSWCPGGPPTTGKGKSLCSPLRAWLSVSQIKTTNYDNVIDSLCVQLHMLVCWG